MSEAKNKTRERSLKISQLYQKASASKQDDVGLQASYNISLLIGKTGQQPHTIEKDLILPAVKEVITAADIIQKIPVSNSPVQRQIDEMAENNEESLCNHLQNSQF
ncbi:SCAN domain-containing protein 3 [Trichonephila clavata]|uniref:SCAN domain-containing protein 3 n=1 Tax=Trichonephila clavata TaxID=2740835 RepID=A0A8X6JM98_TRICU|nr:SCAN domain-containing protein 3 [Trichonephila clavata]